MEGVRIFGLVELPKVEVAPPGKIWIPLCLAEELLREGATCWKSRYCRMDANAFAGTPHQWLVGQGLDAKSILWQVFVQAMSNVCPKDCLLQGLSSRCPTPVKSLSSLIQLGQTLDIKPRARPLSFYRKPQFTILDKVWTNLQLGQCADMAWLY